MSVTESQAVLLAHLLHEIRPAWEIKSLMTLLYKHRDDHEFPELCAAAIAVANDQEKRTPAIIFMDGPHWLTGPIPNKATERMLAGYHAMAGFEHNMPKHQFTTSSDRRIEQGRQLAARAATRYPTAAERKLEAGAALIQKYAAIEGVPMATGTKRAMVGLELARQFEAEERNRQAPVATGTKRAMQALAIDTSSILEEPEPTE
ncbi:hypothetical protein [Crystallibacter degradans]|uniref:hypothetical protein n=1 Tax=Crystallibacter degradans TaxID=2726743 RepID=UPI001474AA5A|nr:hypothetical protein [Arthrobacter sp. SF27]NMR29935.1 hypothetical protein [Arthrobacter sp. SF27]